jgi:hypothetical protein
MRVSDQGKQDKERWFSSRAIRSPEPGWRNPLRLRMLADVSNVVSSCRLERGG